MTSTNVNSFGKLGRLIVKRKYALIALWVILLAVILPVVLTAQGVNSLEMGSSTDNTTESVKAGNIISAQFSSSVANNTLVLVISTNNASSLSTQQFIDQLTDAIKDNASISGVQNITSVYSILVPALNDTNQGVYLAYDNANLTYTMLYSVPDIYLNVWSTAYSQTQDSLIPGLTQTNQGVYQVLDNANDTYNLLYGAPAIYLNAWSAAYSQTNDTAQSNQIAYQQTAEILQQADPVSFTQYTGPLLDAFNASWCMSFLDPTTQNLNPVDRATAVSTQVNQLYINNFLTDASSKAFATALTGTFTLQDFLTNTQDQNNAKLQTFAINYLASSANSSTQFVTAAYDLGRTPNSHDLASLAERITWNGQSYGMGQDFVSTFNDVAYNQTVSILRSADASSFANYTSHYLDLFDAAWGKTLSQTDLSVNQRASIAANQSIPQFINAYMGEGEDLSNAVADALSLQDFLDANTTGTNVKVQNVAVNYVANESGMSPQLVNAIFSLGENATIDKVKTLASNIVWNPDAYNIGQQFNDLLESFVSPNKDVTLISISLDQSSEQNMLNIRALIKSELAHEPGGVSTVQVTGNDALDHDFSQSTQNDVELILPITIALLIIATALFFRSIVTPIITLGTIGVGLGVSQIFPYLVSMTINPVDYTTTTVLLTVLIGVGTDYSIFILARHREERVNSLPVPEAIKKSITWAGESIATSGVTVIISFLALSITSLIMLQTMGIVVGLGVVATLLASLTFAPALAAILGDRIFWPNSGERFQRYAQGIVEKNKRRGGYFAKSGTFAVKHGKVLILLAILVTAPAFYVYATTTPTYNLIGAASPNLESIAASNTLTASFGGSRLMPTYAVVTFCAPIVDNGTFNMGEMATLQNISSMLANHAGVQEVSGPTMPYGQDVDYQTITNASDPATYSGMLSAIGADNQSALITIKFQDDPYSTQAMNYAKDIRSTLHADYGDAANVTGVYLGGTTGDILDTRRLFENQFSTILPIVALGVGIVLFIVLGSLILPVFAIVSVLMSIVWTLAVAIAVFQSAFNYGLLFITPLILFVLLLGLGMDYNIFILTRIREEASKGQHLNDAIVHAIQQTGGIITAAAIILAGSLGTLMLSGNMLLREMGFAFCFSILIDALVVRTYIVPAVMSTFGKWNWYNPIKRLRRLENLEEEKPSEQKTA